MFRYLFFILCFLLTDLAIGQSVRFTHNNLDQALKKAKEEGKSIFVDTYAKWCIPCKRMDPVFRNPRVGKFFNQHFVNLKIDMDATIGPRFKRDYDIIFLPTIMVLDADGKVRYKVDRELSVEELLEIGELTKDPHTYYASQATAISTTPMGSAANTAKPNNPPKTTIKAARPKTSNTYQQKKKTVKPSKEAVQPPSNQEKILYVLDPNSDNLPPEILFEEAYFRMQLMDGSHREVAKKYLNTQVDWKSEKNMQFIHDFVTDTESDEFLFLIINRKKFDSLIGKERINQTIEILVNRKLYRGFPRPNLEEAQALFSYINPTTSGIRAKEYYLERLYQEKKFDEYKEIASDFLIKVNANNAEVYYRLADISSQEAEDKNDLAICLSQINKAIEIDPLQARYYDTKSYIHYRLGNKEEALSTAEYCLAMLRNNNQDTKAMLALIDMIKTDQ